MTFRHNIRTTDIRESDSRLNLFFDSQSPEISRYNSLRFFNFLETDCEKECMTGLALDDSDFAFHHRNMQEKENIYS